MSHKYWATCLYTFLSEKVGDLSGTSLVKETTKNDHRAFLILVGPPSSMLKWGLLVVPLFVPLTRENWENRSPDREKNGEKEEKMSTREVYIPDILPCRPRAREKWSHYLNDEHAHLYLSTQFSAGENSPPLGRCLLVFCPVECRTVFVFTFSKREKNREKVISGQGENCFPIFEGRDACASRFG